MSNFPSVRPSLNLQFDSQPTPEDMTSHLASVGATFSRASIGTYTDANGLIQEASAGQARPNYSSAGVHEGLLIEESRTNLVTSSEDFSTNFWTLSSGGTGSKPIVTVNQGIAPDGTASADRIQFDLNAGSSSSDISVLATNSSISVTNGDHAISVYLKSYDGSSYDLTFGSNNADVNLNKITVTSEWQRFDVLHDVTGSTTNFYFGLRNAAGVSGLSDTADILIWGAQIEEGSFPTSYIPTIPTFSSRASTATYFDSSGVLQTASTNVARTDHKYIDGQWVEAGLLLESASTNLHLNSGDLTGNNSVVNEVSLSLQTVTNPINGQTQVTRITDTAVSDAHYIQSSTITADGSSDYTFSILAKAGTLSTCRLLITGGGVGTVQMIVDLSDGSILSGSGTVQDVANGWYILSVTGTSTASSALATRIYTTDGTNVTYTGSSQYIDVAFRQLEKTSQPTSYIPTSGSTVTRSADVYTTATKTRSADVCYIDGTAFTDFYNQEQGTYFVKFNNVNDLSTSSYIINSNDGTNDERIYLLYGSGGTANLDFRVQDNGSNAFSDNIGTIAENATYKVAIRIKAGDYKGILDGTDISTDTYNDVPDINNVDIGSRGSGNHINGKINKFIYFPRALSDNELIKLTQ